jgi:hypothetical protein
MMQVSRGVIFSPTELVAVLKWGNLPREGYKPMPPVQYTPMIGSLAFALHGKTQGYQGYQG